MEGFLRQRIGGLIFERAYTWRAYFRNFTVFQIQTNNDTIRLEFKSD